MPLPTRRPLPRTFSSLRVRNYRLFFVGQLVSLTGTWMQAVAQTWLVLSLTHSGFALGLTVAMQFLPVLIFGLWGGVIADRLDKRRLLLAAQVVPAVLALVMWGLVVTGSVRLWMVWVLALLLGFVHLVDMPARHSFVVELVSADDAPNAIALNSAMFNTSRLLGPAAAGLTIASFGVAPAFLFNALSFLAVIAALLAMRPEELSVRPPAARRKGDVRAGLAYAWDTPAIRSTLLLVAVVGTFGVNFGVVLPLLARFSLGGGAGLYGLLTSVLSLGSLAGALVAAGRRRPSRTFLIKSALSFGALTMVAASAPGTAGVIVALVPVGAALMLFLATANTTLQLTTVDTMRGRVMALYGLVFLGSAPLGGPLLGWISGRWGGRTGLAFSGVVSLAAGLAAAAGALAGNRNEVEGSGTSEPLERAAA